MYYFLTLIGIILIVIGAGDDEIVLIPQLDPEPAKVEDLIRRIENLEKTLYDVDLSFEEETELFGINYESTAETINITREPITIFDRLRQCEEEGYSLEKTCLILNMNKGEVLLLKNLYKNYQG